MGFIGNLSKFSLPEVFRFLEQGNQTGLLTVRSLLMPQARVNYIWLHQGCIVAASDRLDKCGLISMIAQRGWVSVSVSEGIFQASSVDTAMGLCLKSQGLLQSEQLKLLFRTQITGYICPLFGLLDGEFEFLSLCSLPFAEMTGLSTPATEATLTGLRTLRDWTGLQKKLPDPTCGIINKAKGQPHQWLDTLEWQVWEYANGKVSLIAIAKHLRLTTEKVQQIAFRLTISNLAEEVFIIPTPQQLNQGDIPENIIFADLDSTNAFGDFITPQSQNGVNSTVDSSSKTTISQSFVQDLLSFLHNQAAR